MSRAAIGVDEPDEVLDNRSAPCAVGLIRAATRMAALAPGAVLEVLSRDRFAPVEIPVWAQRDGHTIRLHERTGTWPRRYWRFLICKDGGPAGA